MKKFKATSSGLLIFLIIFGSAFFFPTTTEGSQSNPVPDLVWSVPEREVELWSMAVSSIGNKIAAGFTYYNYTNEMYVDEMVVFNITTGEELMINKNFVDHPKPMSWSPRGRFFTTTGYYNLHVITIINASSGNDTISLVGHKGNIMVSVWAPEEDRIASCSIDRTVRVWDVRTGEELWNITHNAGVIGVCWSPDGKRVVSGSLDGEIKVLNASNGAELFNFTGPIDRGLYSIKLSPDGTKIATGWSEWIYPDDIHLTDIIIWSAKNGTELMNITGDNSHLSSIDWSPDNSMIVAGFWDKKVMIFRASDGKELIAYNFPPSNWFMDVEWLSDGSRIAAQTRGTVIILCVDPDNDGYIADDFPNDPVASVDSDGDSYPDEWNPGMESENSTTNLTKLDDFPFNETQWNDTDKDGWGDNYANISWGQNRAVGIYILNAYKPDRFPLHPTEWNDTDEDGTGDNSDIDIDGDGWNNSIEIDVGTDPYDNKSFPSDLDDDRIPDALDIDIDGDGWNNTVEMEMETDAYDNNSFPPDLDGDGIPDSIDPDRDGDNVANVDDPYPDDPDQWEKEEVSKEGTSTWWWIMGIVIALVVVGTVVIWGKFRKSSRGANEDGNESDKELGRVKKG